MRRAHDMQSFLYKTRAIHKLRNYDCTHQACEECVKSTVSNAVAAKSQLYIAETRLLIGNNTAGNRPTLCLCMHTARPVAYLASIHSSR